MTGNSGLRGYGTSGIKPYCVYILVILRAAGIVSVLYLEGPTREIKKHYL